jgi:hypothetical protein
LKNEFGEFLFEVEGIDGLIESFLNYDFDVGMVF